MKKIRVILLGDNSEIVFSETLSKMEIDKIISITGNIILTDGAIAKSISLELYELEKSLDSMLDYLDCHPVDYDKNGDLLDKLLEFFKTLLRVCLRYPDSKISVVKL